MGFNSGFKGLNGTQLAVSLHRSISHTLPQPVRSEEEEQQSTPNFVPHFTCSLLWSIEIFFCPVPQKQEVTWNTIDRSGFRGRSCVGTRRRSTDRERLPLFPEQNAVFIRFVHYFKDLVLGWFTCNHSVRSVYYRVFSTAESRCLCSGKIITCRK